MGFFNRPKECSIGDALKLLSKPKYAGYTTIPGNNGNVILVKVDVAQQKINEIKSEAYRQELNLNTKSEFLNSVSGNGAYRNSKYQQGSNKYNNYKNVKRYDEGRGF